MAGRHRPAARRAARGDLRPNCCSPISTRSRVANPAGELIRYPGSPFIIRHLLRKQDRLTAIELHPEDARALGKLFADDYQVRVIELDGWLALGAHLPPKEKRGLVIVDPPFEQSGEFDRLVGRPSHGASPLARRHLRAVVSGEGPRRRRGVSVENLRQAGIPKILDVRLFVRAPSSEPRLDGSGMIVVNPPYTLEADLRTILPALQNAMAESPGAGWTLEWLAGEARDA